MEREYQPKHLWKFQKADITDWFGSQWVKSIIISYCNVCQMGTQPICGCRTLGNITNCNTTKYNGCSGFPTPIVYCPESLFFPHSTAPLLKMFSEECVAYTDRGERCACPCKWQRSWEGKDQDLLSPAGTSADSLGSVSAGRGNNLLSVGGQK